MTSPKLDYVLPSATLSGRGNVPDSRACNFKHFGQFSLRQIPAITDPVLPNKANDTIVEFCFMHFYPFGIINTASRNAVGHIIRLGSTQQVGGITARRVVAGMAYNQGPFPGVYKKLNTVGHINPESARSTTSCTPTTKDSELSITTTVQGFQAPRPAFVRQAFYDSLLEPIKVFGGKFGWGKIVIRHRLKLILSGFVKPVRGIASPVRVASF